MMKPFMKGIWLIAGALVLSGCSIKFAYNNLDRFVRWGVNDYVDLNEQQSAILSEEFDRIHLWHRKTHLPEYARFTRNLAVRFTDEVTPENIADAFAQMELWAEEVEAQFTPMVIDIMVTLDDAQVAELPERLAKSNKEWAEDEADKSLAESQAYWAESFEDGMKNFTGRLNKTQRDYLKRRSVEYQPERVLWAAYRERLQAAMLELLDQRDDRAAFAEGYRELVATRESFYGDELKAIFDNNVRLNREVGAHLLSTLTERQSNRLKSELTELAETFEALSEEV